MNDQIIELAKQAGFRSRGDVIRTMHSSGAWVGINDELQRFAELVRNAALDEAAKKCTEIALAPSNVILGVAVTCAEQIRGLKS